MSYANAIKKFNEENRRETKTLLLSVSTNMVGSTCRDEVVVDKELWDHMSHSEREKFMFETLCDSGMFEWDWEENE